jgi:Heavy metal binding domain
MAEQANVANVYVCPMHSQVRQPRPGKCPECGMDLVAEGTRFAILRHMISSPLHLAAMLGLMIAVMVAAMMLMR